MMVDVVGEAAIGWSYESHGVMSCSLVARPALTQSRL
jgi:hypothetical protein